MNFNIFEVFRKNEYSGEYKEIVDVLGDHYKIRLFWDIMYIQFRALFLGQGTEWDYFWGVAKFQIFFGVYLIYLKINVFKNLFQEYHQSVSQTVWIQFRPEFRNFSLALFGSKLFKNLSADDKGM